MADVLKILLFDVDGVIVDPIAYKIGINKSLEFLGQKAGIANIGELLLDSSEIAYFESCGVHDVWDMTNIVFAVILTQLCIAIESNLPVDLEQSFNLQEKMASIKTLAPEIDRPDYIKYFDLIANCQSEIHPPDLILNELTNILKMYISGKGLNYWIEFLRNFLVGTRSAYKSYGTQIFQNIILGNIAFENTYGLPSEYFGQALIKTEDKPLISAKNIDKLLELVNSNLAHISIYTARPSYPPADVLETKGYSPEAEMALAMSGMNKFPVIGMGAMDWLAGEKSERSENLVKPSTTQAMTAILAALTKRCDKSILYTVYNIDKKHLHPDKTDLVGFKNFELIIYVFEDVISGVKAALSAGKKLSKFGYKVVVKPLGIAQDQNKARALMQHCYKVFPHTDEAIEFVLAN